MIPDWLTQKLADCPTAGAGVHAWLFSCARQLHAHMDPAAVAAVLGAAVARAGRPVPGREIQDAVRNSLAVAWTAGPKDSPRKTGTIRPVMGNPITQPDRWPKPDPVARRCRIADATSEGVAGLYDLWEASPRLPDWSADDWIDRLFPGAEWLCLAVDHPATARSRKREKWSFGPADDCGLIVPSTMTGPSGKGLDGRVTHRCLDNTGPRRWLVIEFDSGSIDEQAAIHWHLRASAKAAGWPPLTLCVHSGGKSLHGWYGPVTDEEQARDLMAYAVTLGADPATWTRCQLIRLPGGRRAGKDESAAMLPDGWDVPTGWVRQEVFFFDPTPCFTNNNSLAPGVAPVSTHPRALMAG